MHRTIAVAAMAMIAAGCVSTPPPASAPGQGYRPLEAYVMAPGGGLRFHVSRPAYVAMFEIVPGLGTQLMYPSFGHGRLDGYVRAGDRVIRSRGFGSSPYRIAAARDGIGSVGQPRFLFLIASDRPLRLEQFGPGGYGIQHAMGYRDYASASPYAAMERLAELALPSMIDDGSWTTDFYVFWPEVLQERRSSRDVIVRCNGYRMVVPYEFVHMAQREICGRQTQEDAERKDPEELIGGDSTGIATPGRRSPLPPEAGQEAGRVATSRQLQQPRSGRPETRPVEAGRPAPEAEGSDRRGMEPPVNRAEPGGWRSGGEVERRGRDSRPGSPASPVDPPRNRPASPTPRGARPATPAPRSRPEPRSAPPAERRTKPDRPRAAPPAARPMSPAARPASPPRAEPVREAEKPSSPPRRSTSEECDPCQLR